MVTVVGSIDNAWKRDKSTFVHHLIFTSDSILMFDLFDKKDVKKEIRSFLMSDPMTLIPGPTQSYAMMVESKKAYREIIDQAIYSGNRIEKEIDSEIARQPPEYKKVDYSGISEITLKQGKHLHLPKLIIISTEGKIEYNLMHNNYEKKAYIDEQTFNRYKDLMTEVLGEKATIEG
jgi:hypothetical protein